MAVTSYSFGTSSDGHDVKAWKIENHPLSATLIEYGATIQALMVPDKNGNLIDVVHGYNTLAEYETNGGYVGATIGRVGNRIGNAEFSLHGKQYLLVKNDGENHLHGGTKGFDKQLWKGAEVSENSVSFTRLSPDGEENYPGNLSVSVTFTLTDKGLILAYDADTDADTIVNLTNHSYFNLNGGGCAMDHILQLSAYRMAENDEHCLPTGKLLPVENTPFDFTAPKKISRDIGLDDVQLRNGSGYDHNFVLSGASDAAVLLSEESGIRMTMQTDLPGVQFYTANFLDRALGKDGNIWGRRDAVCLETQLYPNALNCYAFPSPILHAGEHLHSETAYLFDTIQ